MLCAVIISFPHVQDGFTPLYVACQYGHKQIVIVLLENGAHVNLTMTVSFWSSAYSEVSSCLQHLLNSEGLICMQYLCYPHNCCNIPCDKPLE